MSLTLNIPDRPADWADLYTGPLATPSVSAREAFARGLRHPPIWASAAMRLRNLIVKPFGLVTGVSEGSGEAMEFLSKMPVRTDSPDLYETGMTDKHLTFTIRVEKLADDVSVSTHIWFHSAFGRFYLRIVLPAHKAILRRMIRSLGEAA